MLPEEFILAYESALATQNWSMVEPLISTKACVTFSNGSVHKGLDAVKNAFENNFSQIKSEKYSISKVQWLAKETNYAVYLFEYNWTGVIKGSRVAGGGIGTSVIILEKGNWKLLTEHLGKRLI